MPIINIKKELLVAEDIALGTGEITQDRGTGTKVSAQVLTYDDNETISEAIDRKDDTIDVDTKLATKANIQGNELIRFRVANGSLDNEAVTKGQLDDTTALFETTTDVDAKLANKADLLGNDLYSFKVSPGIQYNEAINKLQLDNAIAPLESTASVDVKIADIYSELDNKANISGSVNKTFSVGSPIEGTDAVNVDHVGILLSAKADITYVDTEVATRAPEVNVLLKDGTSPSFSPVSDNQPATKKYVDELVVNIGAGDMAKSVYDINNSGTVDSTEAIGVIGTLLGITPMNQIMRLAQSNVVDANILEDFGLYIGTNITNAPISGELIIAQMLLGDKKHQVAYDLVAPDLYVRAFNGTTWTSWQRNARDSDTVSVAGDTMTGSLAFLNSVGINGYDSGNNLKSLLNLIGDTLNVGTSGLDTSAEGNWNFTAAPTSDITPSNGSDLTTKDYVDSSLSSAVPTGVITMWSGSITSIPAGWYLCDGENNTPDLRDRFVYGASSDGEVNTTGGSADATLVSHVHTTPSHTHTANHNHGSVTSSSDAHTHTANHDHTGTAASAGAHTHTYNYGYSGSGSYAYTNQANRSYNRATGSAGDHTHTVTVDSASVTTSSDTHSHTVDLPSLAVTTSSNNGGDTGTAGESATNKNLPPYMKLAYIMKG